MKTLMWREHCRRKYACGQRKMLQDYSQPTVDIVNLLTKKENVGWVW